MGAHRANRRGRSRRSSGTSNAGAAPVCQPGAGRASKHSASRGSLLRALPSAPLLLGVLVLFVAAGGAVATADLAPSGSGALLPLTAPSATSGTSTVSTASLLRERRAAVSRDLRRDRAAGSAETKLLEAAEEQSRERIAALARIARQAKARSADIARNQWYLPVDEVELTARFGDYGLWANLHTGLDFNGDDGDAIYSVANGVVSSAGYDGSYGYKTVVTLLDGTEIWYAHQTSIGVSEGEVVRGGELIGTIGSTGNVTGSHLHLEVRPGAGDPVDPYAAFQVHGLF